MLTKSLVTTDENNAQTTTLLESYEYDKLNRLVRINNHQTNWYYVLEYDLEGRLILMREYLDEGYGEDNGFYMEEHYVWDGDNLLSTYYMDHTDMDSYRKNMIIRGVDLIGDIVIESYSSDTQNAFYVQNGHGDVVAVTDEDGTVLNSYEYDSYGNVTSANETHHNSLRYCGEIQGIYGDLVYLRNRIYDPEIKRFMTEDPYWNVKNMIYGDEEFEEGDIKIPDMNAIMQSGNLYVYCMNNPMNFVDTNGLWVETVFDVASFGISLKDVWEDPKDAWNWVGLVGDAVDFIPFVAGVGETIKGVKVTSEIADDVSDAKKLTKASSKVTKATKFELPSNKSKNFTKLKNGQGYKDSKGNIWKKDQLHKDHWDVFDKKGNKIREVDFNGNEIWPNGPKNKNK